MVLAGMVLEREFFYQPLFIETKYGIPEKAL